MMSEETHLLESGDSDIFLGFELSKIPQTECYAKLWSLARKIIISFPTTHPSTADIHHEATHAAIAVFKNQDGDLTLVAGSPSEECFVMLIDAIADKVSAELNKRNWYGCS